MKDKHNNYEVYEVCYKGRCVYIGSGEKNRHLHALSGKSSSVKLNELYFTDRDNITVLVLREIPYGRKVFSCDSKKNTLKHDYLEFTEN
jgi:hypothetical protein